MIDSLRVVDQLTNSLSFGDRSRIVGAMHLLIAGAVNILLGITVITLTRSGTFLEYILVTAPSYMDPLTYLERGLLLAFIGTELLLFVGAVVVGIGIGQIIGAWFGYRRRKWRLSVATGIVGMATGVAAPWCLIGVLLLVATADQFE